jgi:hypothetical protein
MAQALLHLLSYRPPIVQLVNSLLTLSVTDQQTITLFNTHYQKQMRTAKNNRNVRGEVNSQQETYTTLPLYPTQRYYTEPDTDIQTAKPETVTSYNRLMTMQEQTFTEKFNN